MGNEYWLPPKHDQLPAYDGYAVNSQAVYPTDKEKGWEHLLNGIYTRMHYRDNSFTKICCWEMSDSGESRFVVCKNRHTEIIAEDVSRYVAVFAIIPEACPHPGYAKRSFPRYAQWLKAVLSDMYPDSVRHMATSRHTEGPANVG